jgi:hypothetical protein
LCLAKNGRWSDGWITGIGGFKDSPAMSVERFEERLGKFCWCTIGFGLDIHRSGVGAADCFGAFSGSFVYGVDSVVG